MKQADSKFLPNPGAIRREIHYLASASKRLDLAVAFIGPEWQRLLSNFAGPIRAVCWLNHPATDPDAVKLLISRHNAAVKQRNGLHTKVYLAPGNGAIVGSANLSHPALTEKIGIPQCEAALAVYDRKRVEEIGKWFNSLWGDRPQTRGISEADLERAKKERKKWPVKMVHTVNPVEPPPEKLPPLLRKLARQVEGVDLLKQFGKRHDQIAEMIAKPILAHSDVSTLANLLASWTKHRAIYRRFERQPVKSIQQGLRTLFDEGMDIHERLSFIKKRKLLKGLRIPAMSLLLYWWRPDSYPPFAIKTEQFLVDFNMASRGMSASSPACYATWLMFADVLRTRLNLPTVGHIDRLVTLYYDRYKSEKVD
jgi:hypothetical protein